MVYEKLGISEPSLLEKSQHRSDPPNMKCNCALLFLRQIYSLFMLPNIFPQTTIVKLQSETFDIVAFVTIH